MLVVHIIAGILIGTVLFSSIFYMGYKTGRKEKIEVADL